MTPPVFEPRPRPTTRIARELAESNGFLLAMMGIGFKAKAVAEVEEAGYHLYDYSVLATLAESERETQGTIAASVGVDPSRVVALLDSLEERGLVERRRDPQDRRRHVVRITPDGRRELTRIRAVVRRIEDDFFGPLDPESRTALHGLLLRLAAHNDPRCEVDPA